MNLKSAHTGKIGKTFKKARILRSMNQNEVAAETLINIEYIKAIESGDYSVFPARMFALQYFKKYSKFLNLEIDFFDIYNAEVVAAADAAEKEAPSDSFYPSFLKKNLVYIFITCFLIFLGLFFAFRSGDQLIDEALDKAEGNRAIEPLNTKVEIKKAYDAEINQSHDEINNFFK